FELEPVAAALHYELTVGEPQNIVVFDFGGGTLDVTVMRIGEPGQRQVFATGGVGIAGDAFDQRIIAGLMLEHFGRGATWGQDESPFPNRYTDSLVNWQTISELNKPETLHFLRLAQITGSHPARARALESLLVNNYATRLIDRVERAKVALSTAHFAIVRLTGQDMDVWQPITRSQFEALIADATRRIEACLLDTLARSNLKASEIDTVVRTGGSAQIPCFIEMMERIFPGKVVLSDVFSGVTAGLAVRAAE
ncbi:MAG: Hsp70 family protein, partial [Chloroflexi bacterium]|nr:Hsp70 family protein [Chloroflexota bacterium]